MNNFVLFLIFSSQLLAQNITKKQELRLKMKKDISYEDLAHENPGCPENSNCSEEMGKLMSKFKAIVESANSTSSINAFKNKFGLPLNFFTKQIDDQMISYNSRCRHHNPKEGTKLYEGFKFIKKIPKNEKYIFETVELLDSKKKFLIPLRGTPFYIKNNKLIIINDLEEFTFYIAISENGNFRYVENNQDLQKSIKYSETVHKCPESKEKSEVYLGHYCRNIYNYDTGKVEKARIDWACP